MATFDLMPAIDLRGGRVVRLVRGDFAAETAYADDPVAVAAAFVEAGARWIHVVDLDGARTGQPVHGDVIQRIVARVGERAAVEVAGGLRSREAVATILGAGAARAVVGTAALADPPFARALVEAHGVERVAVALDVRDGGAVGEAWARAAPGEPVAQVIGRLAKAGVRWFEVTAIDRDGTLGGPDLDLLDCLVAGAPGTSIVASGGIRSLGDLRAVRAHGCAGAIVGRALYEGSLALAAAIAGLEADG